MIIVSDTSPITNLAAVGLLHLLHQLYNRVIMPQAVYDEMVKVGYLVPGTVEVQTLSWIETQPVIDTIKVSQLQNELDLGEAEAIVLALELNADLLIMDERRGRKVASALGITQITGLLGVLLEAKQKGLITAIKPILEQLIAQNNFRISDSLYQKILLFAGE
jgi:predicted nucleic acid-binding protein